MTKLTIKYKHI